MSHYDYTRSQEISAQNPPFYALIMACFRQADTDNLKRLQYAFPAAWAEFDERYNAPGGMIGAELLDQVVSELPETILERKVVVIEASPTKVNLVLGDLSTYFQSPEAIRPAQEEQGGEGWRGGGTRPDETPSD